MLRAGDPQVIATFRSRNFELRTDLSAEEAGELLQRLETMIGFVADYWGRPHRGVISMYVARDIGAWPPEELATMDPAGITAIRSGGGLTVGTVMVRGNAFRSKAIVYAVPDYGVPQHEAVHAYCGHAFGATGPVWYAEGMAEVGNYWAEGDKGVRAPPRVLEHLRQPLGKTLDAIVNSPLETTGDSWENYASRWALCHLLGHNSNYSSRFKPLGLQLLSRADIDFWQVYGSQAQEIEFEYRLFLATVEPGFRMDLCSWDWKTRFSPAVGRRVHACTIRADRGWQASRLLLKAGTEYGFTTSGDWCVGEGPDKVTANGDHSGKGRLLGVILNDYTLSEPFDLGTAGRFTAATDGRLYLRCGDAWGAIADNSGSMEVRTRLVGNDRPVPGAPGGNAVRNSAAADSAAPLDEPSQQDGGAEP